MRMPSSLVIAAAAAAALACGVPASPGLAREASTLAEEKPEEKKLDASLCALAPGDFSVASTNPWFPLTVNLTWEYAGEEDGELVELEIAVLDETEVVGGVVTRVVRECEWIDGALVEVSWNWFASAPDGTVCYFGEDVDIYEDGEVVSSEGAWRADVGGNAPGIIMPAEPWPGVTFPMEVAPGIAEDEGKVVGGGPARVPAGSFEETIRVREHNPLDGDTGFKVYAAGVGLVADGPVELVGYGTATPSETCALER